MDLETAIRLKLARDDYLNITSGLNLEDGEELYKSAAERYKHICTQLEGQVNHWQSPRSHNTERVTPTMPICRAVGPLPNISLRFKYYFRDSGPGVAGRRFNQWGENIHQIWVEWIHSPDGTNNLAEPAKFGSNNGRALKSGEVFAQEMVDESYDLNALAIVEQSLEVYMEALQYQQTKKA
jgi:hypothetical protein